MTRHARRWAALTAAALIGAVVPVVTLGGTSYAADPCEHEGAEAIPGSGILVFQCDDITPPNTAVQADPVANSAGWLNQSALTFTFQATDLGTDTDNMLFTCSLSGPSGAFSTRDCVSPVTVSGLTDSPEAYTFTVTAYDQTDRDTLPGVLQTEPDQTDADTTPATITWRQDTVAPRGLIVGGPYDELTPDFPVLWNTTTQYTLGSSEQQVTATCSLNTRVVPCAPGTTKLTKLAAGTKTFSMRLKDKADNVDQTLRTARFTVPYNLLGTLSERQHWKRGFASGYFLGDYLETRQKGAQLSKNVTFRELRILVPMGPGLGRFRIKVGDYFFRIISEASTTVKHREIVLRGAQTTPMSGLLKVFTLDNKPVRFDAIMYR